MKTDASDRSNEVPAGPDDFLNKVAGMAVSPAEHRWLKTVARTRGQSISELMRSIFWPAAHEWIVSGRLSPIVAEEDEATED